MTVADLTPSQLALVVASRVGGDVTVRGAAREAGIVSSRVSQALQVIQRANDDIKDAAWEGQITVHAALRLMKVAPDTQARALEQVVEAGRFRAGHVSVQQVLDGYSPLHSTQPNAHPRKQIVNALPTLELNSIMLVAAAEAMPPDDTDRQAWIDQLTQVRRRIARAITILGRTS